MPAWVWIVAAAAVAFVLLVTFGRGWWRVRWVLDWAWCLAIPRWWYSWRRARHVLAAECDWCGPGVRCTCRREADPDFYGSMTLAGEREAFLPAPLAHKGGPDWREQTAADLSPEALDDEDARNMADAIADYRRQRGPDDPGSGDLPSLDPGPDHDDDWDGSGPVVDAWRQRQREERERMNAMLVWPEPGPDVARLSWLDQQLAGHLDWARWMRTQVTEWGLEVAAA